MRTPQLNIYFVTHFPCHTHSYTKSPKSAPSSLRTQYINGPILIDYNFDCSDICDKDGDEDHYEGSYDDD